MVCHMSMRFPSLQGFTSYDNSYPTSLIVSAMLIIQQETPPHHYPPSLLSRAGLWMETNSFAFPRTRARGICSFPQRMTWAREHDFLSTMGQPKNCTI